MAYISQLHGKWALVTGASSGIGAALARELAGRGAKLILTARRRDRLEALGQELAAQGIETRIILADLNDPVAPHQIYRVTERAGLEVEILINNAGLGQYGAFHLSDIEQEMSQVRVNCDALVQLSRLFVSRMVERRRGWVLVVASTASFQPVPYITTYAATKAFDRFFALGLAEEVARHGVKVSALCPGPTDTEFFDVARAGFFKRGVQSVEEVARQGIYGLELGRRTIIPNFRSWLGAQAVRLLPVDFVTRQIEKRARPQDGPHTSNPEAKPTHSRE
jgi:uncharacterized protein